jgi:hypothetical protein
VQQELHFGLTSPFFAAPLWYRALCDWRVHLAAIVRLGTSFDSDRNQSLENVAFPVSASGDKLRPEEGKPL